MRRRLRIVRDYRARRHAEASERDAARFTAERFGVSARSVRRFDLAMRRGGKQALVPAYHIHAPPASPLGWPVIAAVLALRAHLGWCGQRIAAELAARGVAQISHTSVYRLFRRHGVATRTYHPVGRRDGIRYRRQRVRAPNWTWHVDFAGPSEDSDGVTRSLVVVVDSHSRMLLALDVVTGQTSEAVEGVLARLFEQHGPPRVLVSDNGRAFAPAKPGQDHRFGRFLAGHGVEHRRSKPYYPQTNGKAEAMVKTVEREMLAHLGRCPGGTWRWSDVRASASSFVGWYNFYRRHGALGYGVPASRYAGVSLPAHGLASIFGLPGSSVDVSLLPEITWENRAARLALALC